MPDVASVQDTELPNFTEIAFGLDNNHEHGILEHCNILERFGLPQVKWLLISSIKSIPCIRVASRVTK